MKRKDYEKPTMNIVMLQQQAQLLAGSEVSLNGGGTLGGGWIDGDGDVWGDGGLSGGGGSIGGWTDIGGNPWE